jgi:K+-transporting ATPase KdpF subunit
MRIYNVHPLKPKPDTFFRLAVIASVPSGESSGGSHGYLLGAMLALLILGYLVYTLIRPEKF